MAKFEIHRSSNNQYYWVFVANNGEIICQSETYVSEDGAVNSINVVKDLASNAKIYRGNYSR